MGVRMHLWCACAWMWAYAHAHTHAPCHWHMVAMTATFLTLVRETTRRQSKLDHAQTSPLALTLSLSLSLSHVQKHTRQTLIATIFQYLSDTTSFSRSWRCDSKQKIPGRSCGRQHQLGSDLQVCHSQTDEAILIRRFVPIQCSQHDATISVCFHSLICMKSNYTYKNRQPTPTKP